MVKRLYRMPLLGTGTKEDPLRPKYDVKEGSIVDIRYHSSAPPKICIVLADAPKATIATKRVEKIPKDIVELSEKEAKDWAEALIKPRIR
jgi:hypothetical protein